MDKEAWAVFAEAVLIYSLGAFALWALAYYGLRP